MHWLFYNYTETVQYVEHCTCNSMKISIKNGNGYAFRWSLLEIPFFPTKQTVCTVRAFFPVQRKATWPHISSLCVVAYAAAHIFGNLKSAYSGAYRVRLKCNWTMLRRHCSFTRQSYLYLSPPGVIAKSPIWSRALVSSKSIRIRRICIVYAELWNVAPCHPKAVCIPVKMGLYLKKECLVHSKCRDAIHRLTYQTDS